MQVALHGGAVQLGQGFGDERRERGIRLRGDQAMQVSDHAVLDGGAAQALGRGAGGDRLAERGSRRSSMTACAQASSAQVSGESGRAASGAAFTPEPYRICTDRAARAALDDAGDRLGRRSPSAACGPRRPPRALGRVHVAPRRRHVDADELHARRAPGGGDPEP